ncbi:MlaC/ttg2D family ABC transporter substrate-binding protein [Dichelobacter nodosus]|uniref:MlaC/ttg2D family ABC transporter substrate-binding protein n=1 Tax=Dichelobacter nodosus TaxID=870 RepID=UPI00107EE5D3|nr:ABC transporter substrate-binding protein [Dichelobacter nodosus]TGA66895.1 ABC transporter substrate-binding protein [Dichelobacter nodosus]
MKKHFLAVAALLLSGAVFAAEPTGESAKMEVETQIARLTQDLNNNKATYDANPAVFHEFISREIAPQLDFVKMSEIALGKHLKSVKDSGKFDAFTTAFRELLIRVYSKGWQNYAGASVRVLNVPSVDKYQRAQVRAQVSGSNANANVIIAVYFKNGAWKVYDATFENVSLMTSYRNTFDTELQQGSVDQLIAKMRTMQ